MLFMFKAKYILHELPAPITAIYCYIKDHLGINMEGIKCGTGYSIIAIKRIIKILILTGLIDFDISAKV